MFLSFRTSKPRAISAAAAIEMSWGEALVDVMLRLGHAQSTRAHRHGNHANHGLSRTNPWHPFANGPSLNGYEAQAYRLFPKVGASNMTTRSRPALISDVCVILQETESKLRASRKWKRRSALSLVTVGGGPSAELDAEYQGPSGFQSYTHSEMFECSSESLATRNRLMQALPKI